MSFLLLSAVFLFEYQNSIKQWHDKKLHLALAKGATQLGPKIKKLPTFFLIRFETTLRAQQALNDARR